MSVLDSYQVFFLPQITQIHTDFISIIKKIYENLFNLWQIFIDLILVTDRHLLFISQIPRSVYRS
jgi:hypothetical protein